ncbi:hypothetical protein CR513_08168, partial [Mucuna pruriens]
MLSFPSCVFRRVTFIHFHNPHLGKLNPRAVKCTFIGYPSNKKGFKCYHPPSHQVFVSMDVTFHKTKSFFVSPLLQGESYLEVESVIELLPFPTHDVQVQEISKPTLVLEQVQLSELEVSILENPIEDVTDDMPIALRKGKRSCVKYPISQFMCIDHLYNFVVAFDAIKTPTSIQEALKDENWIQAMKEEMKVLEKNSTWEIVDRPKDKRVTCGIDYKKTFSPITKMNMVRVILLLATHFGCNLQQFDVKNVFLHGDLEEEVYMEIPPGFCSRNENNKICKLKKALCGIKQSP